MQALQTSAWLPNYSSRFRRVISIGLRKHKLLVVFIAISIYILLAIFTTASAATTKVYIDSAKPSKQAIIGAYGGNTVTAGIDVSNVVDTDGLAGFSFSLRYDPNFIYIPDSDGDGIADEGSVISGSNVAYIPGILSSTGKSVECNSGLIEKDPSQPSKDLLTVVCASIGPAASPTGSGRLATVNFISGSSGGAQQLQLVNSKLSDNTQNANSIPHDSSNLNVSLFRCADNSSPLGPGIGDGVIDLPNDILGVILRNQWNSSHPQWHPSYDLNGDGVIDLANDILGTILQYQYHCAQ